jgi:hypothetical protein
MTHAPRFDRIAFHCATLLISLAALTLPACGTEELRADHVVVTYMPTDPTAGGLLVALAPSAATYDQLQADSRANKTDAWYHLLIDGKELVFDEAGSFRAVVVARGGTFGGGFHAAGAHHFAFVAPGGSTAVETDGVIATGAVNRLYLFGRADELQTRFISYPIAPPPGDQHIHAINLVREGGTRIEIVDCVDATTCTPVSPPLALGDTFDADLPIRATSDGGSSSLSAGGAGYGYRQVPTAALPTPPVLSLWGAESPVTTEPGVPAVWLAAPIYMASDGTFLGGID